MVNRRTSFVEYWSTIWWIAFFETFDPQCWIRDQKYGSERESKTSGDFSGKDNILWHSEIGSKLIRVSTDIAFNIKIL